MLNSLESNLPPIEEMARIRMTRWLKEFSKAAWAVIDKNPLVWNWHLDILCDELQATLMHQGPQNLLTNVPPGTAKSLITSVFAPAWMWIEHPEWSGIFASGDDKVSNRDSLRCRDLINSDWYRNTFRIRWELRVDQDTKTNYKNTEGGSRIATSVGSDITGARADGIFLDDPLDAKDANSPVAREKANRWLDEAYANRLNNPAVGTRVIIMQRLHEEDVSGHVIAQGGYHVVCLPMEFEQNHPYRYPGDPRTQEGELLFPKRFPREVLDYEFKRLGPVGYAGQMQQRPTAKEGNLFKLADWRFYRMAASDPQVGKRPRGCTDAPAVVLPENFDQIWTSWDMNFREATDNDYVAGGVWARFRGNFYLLARFHRRVGFRGALVAVREFSNRRFGKRNRRARNHLIEDKANGSAIVEILKDEIPGIKAVTPEGGKFSRAEAISPLMESGNVYLPDSAPWLDEYCGEHAVFPKGAHDDEVDQTSQALVYGHDQKNTFASKFIEASVNNPEVLGLDPRNKQQFLRRRSIWIT